MNPQLEWARTVVGLRTDQFNYFTVSDAFEILTKLELKTIAKNIIVGAFNTIEQAASYS